MRIGVPARALPDWLRPTRDNGGGQAAEAQRTSLVMLAAARGATLVATAALAFLSPTTSPWVLLGLAVFAVLFMTATTVALWRSAERHRPWMVHVVLTIDVMVWLGACAGSGADESHALMLYVVFPSIAAFAMTGPALAASAVTIAVMRPLLGGSVTEILAFYGIALWAFVVAIAASRGRRLVVRRLRHLDAVWSALARGPSEAVRERVADDLRRTALVPVRAIRAQIANAEPTPEASTALVAELRTIIARIREIAYELYAPPGLHGGTEAGLRHLAQRRSSDADVVVRIDPEVPEAVASPLEATVRDALGLIAGPETTAITIAVRTGVDGAATTIRAVPGNDLEPHRRELRRAALMSRSGVDDVQITHDPDGAAAVRARIHGVAAPDPTVRRLPETTLRESRGFIAAARAGLIPVSLGIPLLVGGTDPGYFAVAAVTCVYLAITAWLLWRSPHRDRWHYPILGCDFAFVTACLLLLGDARPFLLPVTLLIPVAQSMVLPWRLALPVAAGMAVLLPLTGPTPQPAMTIALLWAAAISTIVVRERADTAQRLVAATERRNRLLQRLLAAEDVERRRLAERLHDDVLQLLFGARQDLIETHDGSPGALRRADATLGVVLDRLTETVSDLDVDEGAAHVTGGLLEALAAAARGGDLGPDAQVHVDPRAAGVHDGLLVQFVRELYANAVRHSRASRVQLSVSRCPERIVLDFADDGVGFDFGRVDSAVARGGLGLATLRDRTTWSGGTVELGASEHGGARVLIALPLGDRVSNGAGPRISRVGER